MKKVIILCFIAHLVSCTVSNRLSESEKESISTEVRNMFEEYHQAVAQNGLLGEFSFLDSSDNFFWVPPGYNSAINYDSVRAILEQNNALFNDVSFSWKELRIFPISTEIANYSGLVQSRMIDTAGVQIHAKIIESGTVILREDGWKILSGQSRLLE